MGAVQLYSGHPDEALEWYKKHFEFDPDISAGGYMNVGIAHYLKGDNDKAIHWLKQAATKWPTFLGCHILLASIYAQTGQMDLAAAEKAEILRISPFFKLDFYGQAIKIPPIVKRSSRDSAKRDWIDCFLLVSENIEMSMHA